MAQEPQQQPPADHHSQRLAKLQDLTDHGIEPYGGKVSERVLTADARDAYERAAEDEEIAVTLAGRLLAKRIMGKSMFLDLADESGRLQLYVQRNVIGEDAYALIKTFDIGDIIAASGTMFTTRRGEVSCRVTDFRMLSKSLRPLPEKWHGLTDVEQRYRQRYLDLICSEDVRGLFRRRIQIVASIRRYLDGLGFLEVETPMMQTLAGGAAARPFKTHYNALGCSMYLRIAPELYLKRLLIGGFEKVYEVNRNFRNEGLDRHHNPEFTMLEVYQAYSDCRGMMDLVEDLICTVARETLDSLTVEQTGGATIDLTPPWRRVAYKDLIREHLGDDWYELSASQQQDRAKTFDLHVEPDWTPEEVTHEIYEKVIEATLLQPTFVTRLPAFLVPLAKRCDDDPTLVDVYELEINGQEISPGYSELNDPVEQRRRFKSQLDKGELDDDREVDRIDEDFLLAMEHGMPPAGGLGLGIDRLVMILTGAESIRDVILFPQMRPIG